MPSPFAGLLSIAAGAKEVKACSSGDLCQKKGHVLIKVRTELLVRRWPLPTMKTLKAGAETRKSLCLVIFERVAASSSASEIDAGSQRKRVSCGKAERNCEKAGASGGEFSGSSGCGGKRGSVAVIDFADEKRKRRKIT